MEVIASTTAGFLISATPDEINSILSSVNGKAPKEIIIGQKIPAIDYAASITQIKGLKESYDFRTICTHVNSFKEAFDKLKEKIDKAASTNN